MIGCLLLCKNSFFFSVFCIKLQHIGAMQGGSCTFTIRCMLSLVAMMFQVLQASDELRYAVFK